jgi:hypothetical protein
MECPQGNANERACYEAQFEYGAPWSRHVDTGE